MLSYTHRSAFYVLCIAASTLGLDAQIETFLTADPQNRTSATLEWTVYANGTAASVANGNSAVPTTGSLSNATGSFTYTWTSTANFDPNTFAGDASTIEGTKWAYNDGDDTFGPQTAIGPSIQVNTGEAIVMDFDLSGLTLEAGYELQLESIWVQNTSNGANDGSDAGARFSFFDASQSQITQLVGPPSGSISVVPGFPAEQPINQVVATGDRIAFWRADLGGQVRMMGFKFRVVGEPPVLETLLTEDPGNATSATIEWIVYANGTDSAVVSGNSSVPTTGALANATGSLTATWTSTENFNPQTFAGDISTVSGNKWAYDGSNDTFGPVTASGPTIQVESGEAIVMEFDLNGLSLAPGYALQLESIWTQNSADGSDAGARFSFRDVSRNEIIQLTGVPGGADTVAVGDSVEQTLKQIISTGDQIAFWRDDFSGQVRMMGFAFSVLNEPSSPIAMDDTIDAHAGLKVRIGVLHNDLYIDDLAQIEILSQPTSGTATLDGDSILYEPTSIGSPTDSFTYRLIDIDGRPSGTATVTLQFSDDLRIPNAMLNVPSEGPTDALILEPAFDGISFFLPLSITSPPFETNRVFVSEKFGTIQLVKDLGSIPSKQLFFDLATEVNNRSGEAFNTGGESGLLGLAFHPNYASNGYFYVFYSVNLNGLLHQRVSRFSVSQNPDLADANSEVILIEQRDEAGNHNGGDIHFGPDGYLYISVGDEGGGNDDFNNSQTITKDYFSGILRIDVDRLPGNLEPNNHPSVVRAGNGDAYYAVPADNPWTGANPIFNGVAQNAADVITEFYAVGLRNAWRTHFDPLTGDFYVADVGQGAREEINLVTSGGNYGWAYFEASLNGPDAPAPGGFVHDAPIYEYTRGSGALQGASVTGGVVYRGSTYSQLYGKYIFGDYVSGNIWALEYDGNSSNVERITGSSGPVGFGYDPSNGDVLVADINTGQVMRLTGGAPTDDFPETLSATNIFADLSDLTPNPGVLYYEPNLAFWSDHAIKSRWFVIPDANATMSYDQDGAWTYPSGMIWIKHFDIELERGNPATKKRLETRLLVKNDSGAYGVSYRWNEAETEAYLVPQAGENFTLDINDGGQMIQQTWQIPSRTSCFTCHLPSAGYSLSFNTRQLNRDHNLGGLSNLNGLSLNQIASLRDAGYLDGAPADLSSTPRHYASDETDISLEARARSYLAVNCAYCHNDGAANPGSWDGSAELTLDETALLRGGLNNNGGDPSNRLIAPGDTTHSVILSRMQASNGFSRMPPLATSELDEDAIALVVDWINNELPGTFQTYDEWRTSNFGNNTDPVGLESADADGDGTDNELEWYARTDPNDAADFWQPTIGSADGSSFQIDVETVLNRSTVLMESPDLTNWTRVDDPNNTGYPPATSGVQSFTLPIDEAAKFFRVEITE